MKENAGIKKVKHFALNNSYSPSQVLLDHVQAFFFLLDEDFRIVHFNRFAEEVTESLFNQKCEIGDDVVDLFPEKGKEELEENLSIVEDGKTVKDVIFYDLKNGGKAYFRYQMQPSEIEGNRIYILSGNDISEQIYYEQKDVELTELLNNIMDSISSSITIINVEGVIQGVNQPYLELSGYSREELVGNTVWSLTTPEDSIQAQKDFEHYLNTGLYPSRTYKLIRKDGSMADVIIQSRKKIINSKLFIITTVTDVTEMTSLQRKLELTLARNSTIINNVDIHLWSLDTELNFMEANRRTREMLMKLFGYRLKIGDSFWNRYKGKEPKSKEYWEENLKTVLKDKRTKKFEFTEATNGMLVHKSVKLYPILDLKKEMKGINCQMVIDTEDYLKRILDITLNNLKARLFEINSINELLWAVTDEVLSKLHLEDALILVKQRNELKLRTAYGKLRGEGKTVLTDLIIKVGEGITGHVAETAQPLLVNDVTEDSRYFSRHFEAQSEAAVPIMVKSQVYGVINIESVYPGFFQPVHLSLLEEVAELTAVKIAQIKSDNQVKKMERLNQAILNSTSMSFFLLNKKYQIESFNKVAYTETLKSSGQSIARGYDFLQLVPPEEQEDFKNRISKVLEGELYTTETETTGSEGKMWISITMAPAENKKGEIFGVTLISENITSRKKNEKTILAKNRELKKTNRELDSFVYSASHDLRAPVSNIMGLSDMIDESDQMEEIKAFNSNVKQSALRLDNVIRSVIQYSRNSRERVTAESFYFSDLLDEVLSDLVHLEGYPKVRFVRNIEQPDLITVNSERCKLVLNNLISNAIDYRDEKKKISEVEVSFTILNDHYQIRVKDNGQGISKELIPKIFDMFFVANLKPRGSGLGLYILKEAVAMLNGSIEVKSKLGKGSEFIVTLPRSI